MSEEYLEWLFLREILGYFIDHPYYTDGAQFRFQGNGYDIKKLQNRYSELTKELLLEYEL